MGHSLGEWAAAVGAGSHLPRGAGGGERACAGHGSVSIGDKGKMASVAGPADEIGRRLPKMAAISPWQHQQPQADRHRGRQRCGGPRGRYFNSWA